MKKALPTIEQQLDELRAIWIADYDDCIGRAESPIERLLLATLLSYGWAPGSTINFPEPIAKRLWHAGDGVAAAGSLQCIHDQWMGALQPRIILPSGRRIRADFLFWHNWETADRPLVVECDGHNFHERTKEQAAADKSRDRELLAIGWQTMRFAGSELFAEPWDCVAQIHGHLNRLAGAAAQ